MVRAAGLRMGEACVGVFPTTFPTPPGGPRCRGESRGGELGTRRQLRLGNSWWRSPLLAGRGADQRVVDWGVPHDGWGMRRRLRGGRACRGGPVRRRRGRGWREGCSPLSGRRAFWPGGVLASPFTSDGDVRTRARRRLTAVLRLAKLTDAEYVLGQVASGLEDYYVGSGEAPGVWAGRLAAELGLAGVVAGDDLRALLDQKHPDGSGSLGGGKQPKVRAFDGTFSAPKSVSLLWAFAAPDMAAVASIAHVEAVSAALGFLEVRAAVTRRQVDGVRTRAGTSGWAVATFVHRTSGEGDPQLHTHCVIPNLVCRNDGTWVALDATACYRWAKAAGSVYQEELRRRLSERLGVGWGPDRNGCREMTGVSEAQLRVFSKRTAQIDAYLDARGGVPGERRARMRADEAASVATRRAKDPGLNPAALAERWQAEAAAAGLPTGEALVESLQATAAAVRPVGPAEAAELFERLVDAGSGLCVNDSAFGEAQVVEAIAAWGAGRLSVGDIEELTGMFLRARQVVRLVDVDPSRRAGGRWSTVAHLRVEEQVLYALAVLQARATPRLPDAAVADAVTAAGRLCGDQATAVRTLAGPGVALRSLVAPAGHGKTTTLTAAVDAAGRAGRAVVALSTTNQAVDQLREVGIPATTVARFGLDRSVLEPGSVVIVDEVSQLPTHEAALGCPRSPPAPAGRCGWSATRSKPSRSAPAVWPPGSTVSSATGRWWRRSCG